MHLRCREPTRQEVMVREQFFQEAMLLEKAKTAGKRDTRNMARHLADPMFTPPATMPLFMSSSSSP
jgi:hypothetical protein